MKATPYVRPPFPLPLPVDAESTIPKGLKFSVRTGGHLEPVANQCGIPGSQRGPRNAGLRKLSLVPSAGIRYSRCEGIFYVDVFHYYSVIVELNYHYLDSDNI